MAKKKKKAKKKTVKKKAVKKAKKPVAKAPAKKTLRRSSKNRMIAGVCGGLGEYLGVDPTIIRLLWAIITLLAWLWPGVLIYIIAALVIPKK